MPDGQGLADAAEHHLLVRDQAADAQAVHVDAVDDRAILDTLLLRLRQLRAAPLQEVVWGVIPQVAPLWTSYALYRFESNSRAATVLGLIGAGGIGQILFDSLNSFAYSRVAAIAIVIVVAVTVIDLLSQTIRSRLL